MYSINLWIANEKVESSENATQLQNTQQNSKHSGQQCTCHISSPCRYVTQVAMATIDLTVFVFFLAVFVRTQLRLSTHLHEMFLISFFCVIVFNMMLLDADVVMAGATNHWCFILFTIFPRYVRLAKVTSEIFTEARYWKINKSKVSVVWRLRTCDVSWILIWPRDY